jgi:hypothetical protein
LNAIGYPLNAKYATTAAMPTYNNVFDFAGGGGGEICGFAGLLAPGAAELSTLNCAIA